MWIVRWFISALLIIVILGFALQNQEQTVYIKIFHWTSPVLPLYFFLYIAFGIGLLFWFLMSSLNMLKMRNQVHRLKKDNLKIKEELNRLRNISIEEEVEPTDLEED
jgi:uncharacterized integral membrane protein